MEEIWKPIKGYEGLYEVSNLGRIKTLSRYIRNRKMPEKIKKLDKSKNGYLRIELSSNKIKRKYLVHRLVAQAFIPNKKNLPCINHKDEDKSNNIVSNLEWCDYLYNNLYNDKQKKNWKKVKQLNQNNDIINIFESVTEASKRTNILQCRISNCLNNRQKTAGGYHWQYYELDKNESEDK